ncbi:MAG TPA: hypothetical protein ENJ41_07420, partial [Oceanospirillales bacterium]|nr:hypothetical protein [Oceanospirillales bacterium]
MTNKWLKTSIITGIIAGILALILSASWKTALIIAVVMTVLMIINNPKKRYMRVFWMLTAMFGLLNSFAFQFVGQVFDRDFEIKNNMLSNTVSIALVVLAAL